MGTLDDTLMHMLERMARLEKRTRDNAVRDAAGGYWVAMAPWTNLSPFAASAGTHLITVPRDITIKKLVVSVQTATTNNAGNHWTLALNDGAANVQMVAQTLEADAINTWLTHTYTTFAINTVLKTSIYFLLLATKVGAPMLFFI